MHMTFTKNSSAKARVSKNVKEMTELMPAILELGSRLGLTESEVRQDLAS